MYNLPNGEENEKRGMPQPRGAQPGTEAAGEPWQMRKQPGHRPQQLFWRDDGCGRS